MSDPVSDPVSQPIRAAASVILWRQGAAGPELLMGMRGAAAVFMPSKYVFPGGAVDQDDAGGAGGAGDPGRVAPECLARLAARCPAGAPSPAALIGAALRELAEETGLVLRRGAGLRFIFRAITPPGRTRRFDARFFLAAAGGIAGDADDFSAASDELSHLHWVGLAAARRLALPFITEVVIAEVAALLAGQPQPGVPFFDNSGPQPVFRRLD